MHRQVWEDHFGEIPKGFHVHHKDGNTLNNDISNLECITAKKHREHHPFVGDVLDRQLAHLENIRPLSKAWHASEEGRKKHAEIGAMAWKNFKPKEKTCDQCGGKFNTSAMHGKERFCGNACKSAWRRSKGIDDVVKQCGFCGEQFTSNKYQKASYCSRSCAARGRSRDSKKSV